MSTENTTIEVTINEEAKQVMLQKVANLLDITESEIDLDNTLEYLGADDLDEVEIIMQLEKDLAIIINDAQWDSLLTINDKLTYVSTLVEAR